MNKRRKAIVGNVLTLPTEAIALRSARALRIDANAQTPQAEGGPETIADLVAHYRLKELNENSHSQKSFPSRAAYQSYLENWVLPRWGGLKLDQIKPVAVEEWLNGITRARATKAKIRNLMSAIFHHAMRYEWTDRNPIKLVRQSAKREKVPDVLELAELQLLLSKLSVRERTLALLDAATGLRVSELLALRWQDVDFEDLELNVTRSIWHQVVGDCKTEASAKPVPLDGYMAEDLLQWRKKSPYLMQEDWVFASPTMKGEQPVLARQSDEALHQAGRTQSRHHQEHRLAYLPPLLRHVAEGERGRCEDRTGALEAREQPHHARRLHAGSELEQASRTEQGCKDDGLKRGHNFIARGHNRI
jgi:integrase